MRHLLLSILVLFATQPLQASFCDMGADHNTSHQTMPHSDLHANMDHRSGDDKNHGSDNHTMDCCDDESASGEQACADMVHCGACPAGLVAVSPAISSTWVNTSRSNVLTLSQVPPNQFSSPPFRPPIA